MKMATLPLPSETRDPHLSPEQRIRKQEFSQQLLELAPPLHPLLLGEDKGLEGKGLILTGLSVLHTSGGQRVNPDRTVHPPHIWRATYYI